MESKIASVVLPGKGSMPGPWDIAEEYDSLLAEIDATLASSRYYVSCFQPGNAVRSGKGEEV
jgi:hypothetical protein